MDAQGRGDQAPAMARQRVYDFIKKVFGDSSGPPTQFTDFAFDASTGKGQLTLFGRAFAFTSPSKYEPEAKEGCFRAALCRDILSNVAGAAPPHRQLGPSLKAVVNRYKDMSTLQAMPVRPAALPIPKAVTSGKASTSGSASPLQTTQQQRSTQSPASRVVSPTASVTAAGAVPAKKPPVGPKALDTAVGATVCSSAVALSAPLSRTPSTQSSKSERPPLSASSRPAQPPADAPSAPAALRTVPSNVPTPPAKKPVVSAIDSIAQWKPTAVASTASNGIAKPSPIAEHGKTAYVTSKPQLKALSALPAPKIPSSTLPVKQNATPSASIKGPSENGQTALAPLPNGVKAGASAPPQASTSSMSSANGTSHKAQRDEDDRRSVTSADSFNEIEAWRQLAQQPPPKTAVERLEAFCKLHLGSCRRPEIFIPYLDFDFNEKECQLRVAKSTSYVIGYKPRPEDRWLIQHGKSYIEELLARRALGDGVLAKFEAKKMPKHAIRADFLKVVKRYQDASTLAPNDTPKKPATLQGSPKHKAVSPPVGRAESSSSMSMSPEPSRSDVAPAVPSAKRSANDPHTDGLPMRPEPLGQATTSHAGAMPALTRGSPPLLNRLDTSVNGHVRPSYTPYGKSRPLQRSPSPALAARIADPASPPLSHSSYTPFGSDRPLQRSPTIPQEGSPPPVASTSRDPRLQQAALLDRINKAKAANANALATTAPPAAEEWPSWGGATPSRPNSAQDGAVAAEKSGESQSDREKRLARELQLRRAAAANDELKKTRAEELVATASTPEPQAPSLASRMGNNTANAGDTFVYRPPYALHPMLADMQQPSSTLVPALPPPETLPPPPPPMQAFVAPPPPPANPPSPFPPPASGPETVPARAVLPQAQDATKHTSSTQGTDASQFKEKRDTALQPSAPSMVTAPSKKWDQRPAVSTGPVPATDRSEAPPANKRRRDESTEPRPVSADRLADSTNEAKRTRRRSPSPALKRPPDSGRSYASESSRISLTSESSLASARVVSGGVQRHQLDCLDGWSSTVLNEISPPLSQQSARPSSPYSEMQAMTGVLTKLAEGSTSYDDACAALYHLRLPAVMDSAAFDALDAIWKNSPARMLQEANLGADSAEVVLVPKSWVSETMDLLRNHTTPDQARQ